MTIPPSSSLYSPDRHFSAAATALVPGVLASDVQLSPKSSLGTSKSTGSDAVENEVTFAELGLGEALVKTVGQLGFVAPTPVQSATIPAILSGRDVLARARTGSGKTGAFALPILEKLANLEKLGNRSGGPVVLTLSPTRELASQIANAFRQFASNSPKIKVAAILGGESYTTQLREVRAGAQIVVATPGRLQDLVQSGKITLSKIDVLVLDEADEMLKMGFREEVEAILKMAPKEAQILLFSATMPPAIRTITRKYLKDGLEINIESSTAAKAQISQLVWQIGGVNKVDALDRYLAGTVVESVLVFTRTKTATIELAENLQGRGYKCAALNGDMKQEERKRTVERLRQGKITILIATDVAARGLDIPSISHVINYDFPNTPETYVHRIGRTGRAGRSGTAILFAARGDMRDLRDLERATHSRIAPLNLPSPAEVLSRQSEALKNEIRSALSDPKAKFYQQLFQDTAAEMGEDPCAIGGAALMLASKQSPLEGLRRRVTEFSRDGGEVGGVMETTSDFSRDTSQKRSARPKGNSEKHNGARRGGRPAREELWVESGSRRTVRKGKAGSSRSSDRFSVNGIESFFSGGKSSGKGKNKGRAGKGKRR